MDVISVLVGCLLGDLYASVSNSKSETNGVRSRFVQGTKFRFKQSARHKDYLFFLYDFFFTRGYCTDSGPRQYKVILVNSSGTKKTHYGYEFDIYTFSSLNWLYDLFYVNKIKRISPELINYLTPMSLAFLIMDDGT